MDTFPLFVYQALAELPPKQAQLLRALAEEDRTLFYETMLKLRKHQRIQKSGQHTGVESTQARDRRNTLYH